MTPNRDSRYNTAAYRHAKAVFIAAAVPVCTWPACPVPGRVVNKALSGNARWGPTIDHAVPISQGGGFWEGWQLMHRRCNLEKGDRPMPRAAGALAWLDDDTAVALAWQDEQNLKCPGCGRPTYKDGHTHACW